MSRDGVEHELVEALAARSAAPGGRAARQRWPGRACRGRGGRGVAAAVRRSAPAAVTRPSVVHAASLSRVRRRRRYRRRRESRPPLFAHRVRPSRGHHADLRLRRPDGRARPARDLRRAARLRPVRRRTASGSRAPRGWEVLRLAPDPSTLAPVQRRPARPRRRRPRGRPAAGRRRPGRRAAPRGRPAPAARSAAAATCGCSPRSDRRPCRRRRVRLPRMPTTDPAEHRTPSSRRTTCGAPCPTRSTRSSPGAPARRSSRSSAPTTVVVGHDMRPQLAGPGRGVRRRRGRRRRRRDADRAGLDRPALLRLRAPRPPRRDVHREPQPGAVQRHQDVPRRRPAGRRGHRARRDPRRRRRGPEPRRRARRARSRSATCSRRTPPTCSSLAPVTGRRLKVVVDAGNGMAGLTAPAVFERLGDGGRAGADVLRARRHLPEPRGQPDRAGEPRRPAEARSSRRAPTSAWPSTATPTAASSSTSAAGPSRPSTLTALIAARELAKEPGRDGDPQPDHQPRACPRSSPSSAARPVRTRVGHSFIKATMAETDAVFGGEHSGHFYFRDFWRADSGMLAALHALAALAETDRPLSELLARLRSATSLSGEINSDGRRPGRRVVGRDRGGVRRAATASTHRPPRRAHRRPPTTGGSTSAPSNTEPLLRLNAEGADDRPP